MKTFKKLLLSIASVAVVGGATASLVLLSNDVKEVDASAVTSRWDENQFIKNPFFKNDSYFFLSNSNTVYKPIEQSIFIKDGYIGIECNKLENNHVLQEELTIESDGIVMCYLQENGGSYEQGFRHQYNLTAGVKSYCYNQSIFNNSNIANDPVFIFTNSGASNTLLYSCCVFDLTNIFGSGKEPDKDTFHQQFLGYEAGYKSGVADGAKTQVTTSINNFTTVENLNDASYPSSPAYYSSKSVGAYSSTASNLYWSSSAYGNSKITRTETNHGGTVLIQNNEVMTYFQVANYTKYLNTTKTDVSFSPTINLTVPSGSFSWKVYYTTQDMSQWNDVSSWQTTIPIVPSDAFLSNCELVSDWALDDVYLGQGLTASGQKKEITASSFSMFVIMTITSGSLGSLNDLSHDKIYAGTVTTTFTMDKSLSINYEVVDLPAFFYTLLTAPFSFISTAFNVTLFNGTPYALNISSLIMGVLGSALIIIVIKIIGGIIKSL